MGEITARSREGHNYKVQIRQGNCLAVMITVNKQADGGYLHSLWSFFVDADHMRRISKHYGGDPFCGTTDVRSIKLNLAYKESNTLLKVFTKAGYKVTCYYKEDTK